MFQLSITASPVGILLWTTSENACLTLFVSRHKLNFSEYTPIISCTKKKKRDPKYLGPKHYQDKPKHHFVHPNTRTKLQVRKHLHLIGFEELKLASNWAGHVRRRPILAECVKSNLGQQKELVVSKVYPWLNVSCIGTSRNTGTYVSSHTVIRKWG